MVTIIVLICYCYSAQATATAPAVGNSSGDDGVAVAGSDANGRAGQPGEAVTVGRRAALRHCHLTTTLQFYLISLSVLSCYPFLSI